MANKRKQGDKSPPRRSKKIKGEPAERPQHLQPPSSLIRRSRRIKGEPVEEVEPESWPKPSQAPGEQPSPEPAEEIELPPLLDLPAELGNVIYEYALQENDDVDFNRNFREPGLLSANRQARREARSLFYDMNVFKIIIPDGDANLIRQLALLAAPLRGNMSPRVHYVLQGKMHWQNLMTWCEHIFDGESYPIRSRPGQGARAIVVGSATQMAFKFPYTGWKSCEEALESWRAVAGPSDPERLDEH